MGLRGGGAGGWDQGSWVPNPIFPAYLSWKGKEAGEGDPDTLQVRRPVLRTTGTGSGVLELGPGRCCPGLHALTLALPLTRHPAQLEVEGRWGKGMRWKELAP